MSDNVALAAELYVIRKDMSRNLYGSYYAVLNWDRTHPDLPTGSPDGEYRYKSLHDVPTGFYSTEVRDCCNGIQRTGMYAHQCTAKHIANLFSVDRVEVLREVKVIRALMALENL